MTNPIVLLVGGPETGKSNFLFKLWAHIFAGKGRLERDGFPTDVEYLREGAACQLRGEYAGHTSQSGQVLSRIPIRLKGDHQKKATLIVPDIDGEQINKVYRDRKWSSDWDEQIGSNSAFLFFVRVNSPLTVSPLDWVACHELYGFSLSKEVLSATVDAPNSPNTAQPLVGSENRSVQTTTPVEPPTQIVLVEWIQFILAAISAKHPNPGRIRIGIVVTAWDCVPADFSGDPAQWIRENMPFLHQFCESNRDVFDVSCFGSSIFSGDPQNDPEYSETLTSKDPRTLGYVHGPSVNPDAQDFTVPIAWALGWESQS